MGDPDWLTEEVCVVEELLSAEECRRLIDLSEELGYEEALVTSPEGPVRVEGLRNNDRVIHDDRGLAEQLWTLAQEVVPLALENCRAVGLNERFRFYRYDPGQLFDWHQDASYESDDGDHSLMTFMVYLNDGFEGGATSFDDSCSEEMYDEFQVTPATGLGLFFIHSVCHKGEPVVRGRKYVLRTDVMYRPRMRRRKRRRR
jgi:predicted 2-oxoglutarate/Fe(II)-dependent dioxygenase YbiX